MMAKSLPLRLIELSVWAVFIAAWVQMGWVDWTQQKIRNRYLALWLKIILFAYSGLLAHSLLGRRGYLAIYINLSYYADLTVYVFLSCVAGVFLWWLRIWPAGDAKLFTLLSLFYPLMRVPGNFRSGVRFLEVLINIFLPAAFFVFLTAAFYLWRTRFTHQKDFLVELGLKKIAPYLQRKIQEAWALLKAESWSWVLACRDPKRLLGDAAVWLTSIILMSLVSYALGHVVESTLLKTLLCFALFFLWSRFCQLLGPRRALALVAALFAWLFWRHPDVNWAALSAAFGHVSIFSLFIFFGIQIAFKIVAGQTGFFFLPLLFMLPGLIPWWWLRKQLEWPSLARFQEVLGVPSGFAAGLDGLMIWAGMGLFFGLGLVFVKIWDAESYQSVSPEQLKPYMTLGPAIWSRIEEDGDFFEEHFQSRYADGLTVEQAEVLKDWCRRSAVDQVPLAPTISFANWIFVGYFLTLILQGHVLAGIY